MYNQYRYVVALVNIPTHATECTASFFYAASCGEFDPERLN